MNSTNGLRLFGMLLVFFLLWNTTGLSAPVYGEEDDHALYLPFLVRPLNDDEEYYINHYTPVYVTDIGNRVTTDGSFLPTNKTVIHTAELGNMSSQPAGWSVGDFTGFYPSNEFSASQRGVAGGAYGDSAVQMESFSMGFFIRSRPPSDIFPYQLAQFYYGFDPAIHPWAYGPNTEFCVDHDAAVPYSEFADGSVNYTYNAYQLFDDASKTRLWLSFGHYDQRPEIVAKGDVPHWWPEAAEPIATGIYGGDRYSTLLPGSSTSMSDTWSDWRYFGNCVSRDQLRTVIADVNRSFDFGLSTDPSNYSLISVGIGPEMYIQEGTSGEMSMRLRDVRIFSIIRGN